MTNEIVIPPHGGYKKLLSYQTAEIIYDLTVEFCDKYVEGRTDTANRTYKYYCRMSDQMIQAARSGKQNICEGSQVSGTSKKSELKLMGVARGSLEELLKDYEDFLRQRKLALWGKDEPRVQEIRKLGYEKDRSYSTYMAYINNMEAAANALVCLINQANYLLDRQIKALEKDFLENGGFTERLYHARRNSRGY